MKQKNNEITVMDIHKFIWNNYTHSVEAAILAVFPTIATVILLLEVINKNNGVLFYICSAIIALGIIGNIFYYKSAFQDKKRIGKLITSTFPNYQKNYHNLLFKAYEEVAEKEIGRVEGKEEILLIKSVFDKKMADYEKLIDEVKKDENEHTLPIYISKEAMQSHFAKIGRPQGESSFMESKITEASKENGMILIVKSNTLPSGAMHEEVDLKGRVLIASSISDNTEMIEQQLIELDMIDEFDDSKSKKIIELATDLLSHHGSLDIK